MEITPYLTSIMALLGMVIGTLISPKINQKVNAEHNRKDLIFKKKFEYFERIAETLEENRRTYQRIIGKLEKTKDKKEMAKVIEELKQKRKNFLIKSSPLYFDTRKFSEKIVWFVRIEKNIFHKLEQMNKENKEETIEKLKEDVRKLNSKGNEIIIEMRRELSKSY